MSEKDFLRALREFHGPEKFTELRGISVFGRTVNLYRFYQAAKRRGGSTDAVIITRWRDICLDIGVLSPGDHVTLDEAHKASQYFCDCFNNFVYPARPQPTKTRYGRQTKPRAFPNYYKLPYKNSDNNRSRRPYISDDNLIWMARKVIDRPKYKFFSNNSDHGNNANKESSLDKQWILATYDSTVPLPYKIQSKVACAAKLAAETMTETEDPAGDAMSLSPQSDSGSEGSEDSGCNWSSRAVDAAYGSVGMQNGSRRKVYSRTSKDPEYESANESKNARISRKELIENIVHEVAKFLLAGHDLEICLTIMLKAFMVISVPQVPGLIRHLARINTRLSEELAAIKEPHLHKSVLHILDLTCNILTLVLRDHLYTFLKGNDDPDRIYHQSYLCLESLQTTACVLFLKIQDLYTRGAFEEGAFALNMSAERGGEGLPYTPMPGGYHFQRQTTGISDFGRRSEVVNHMEILVNIVLLVRYLAKISTESWQFELVCTFINPFLKVMVSAALEDTAPEYWLWHDFQQTLCSFFSCCNNLAKKMEATMQIGLVTNLYILAQVILKEKGLDKRLFRKLVRMILTFQTHFDFTTLHFMTGTIRDTCKILVETLLASAPRGIEFDINGISRSSSGSYVPSDNGILQFFDRSARERRSSGAYNLYLNVENPVANPWSALPRDYTSIIEDAPKTRSSGPVSWDQVSASSDSRPESDNGDEHNLDPGLNPCSVDLSRICNKSSKESPTNMYYSLETLQSRDSRGTNERVATGPTSGANLVRMNTEIFNGSEVSFAKASASNETVAPDDTFVSRFFYGVSRRTDPGKPKGTEVDLTDKPDDILYYHETLPRNHKLSLEEAVSFLQKYYKNVFGISTTHLIHPLSKHRQQRVSRRDPLTRGRSGRNSCSPGSDCGSDELKGVKEDSIYEDSGIMDSQLIDSSRNYETTREITCLCIAKMTRYSLCMDIIRSNYNRLLECAFMDRAARSLWPVIHKLQSEDSIILDDCGQNYQVAFIEPVE